MAETELARQTANHIYCFLGWLVESGVSQEKKKSQEIVQTRNVEMAEDAEHLMMKKNFIN